MASSVAALVEAIHATPTRCVLSTTGAGGSAISALMSVAGCSRTVLSASVPYSMHASYAMLDCRPPKLLCADIGRDLAQHAFKEAERMVPSDTRNLVGIGATAAIATDRTRRGEDVVFVSSWKSGPEVVDYTIVLSKERTRESQEAVVRDVILKALADASGVPFQLDGLKPEAGEELSVTTHAAPASTKEVTVADAYPLTWLLEGSVGAVLYDKYGAIHTTKMPYSLPSTAEAQPSEEILLLFPGSFNPVHWGHKELALAASLTAKQHRLATSGTEAPKGPITVRLTFELALSRVGKGSLSANGAYRRVEQFLAINERIAVTTAKLFSEKAQLFPNHGLVVGLDTMVRILDPVYYNFSRDEMIAALLEIHRVGCYFLVAGRAEGVTSDGGWRSLKDIEVPEEVKHMIVEIPAAEFRADISSTAIRRQRTSEPPSPRGE